MRDIVASSRAGCYSAGISLGAHCACPAHSTAGHSHRHSAALQIAAWPVSPWCWPGTADRAARSRLPAVAAGARWAADQGLQGSQTKNSNREYNPLRNAASMPRGACLPCMNHLPSRRQFALRGTQQHLKTRQPQPQLWMLTPANTVGAVLGPTFAPQFLHQHHLNSRRAIHYGGCMRYCRR